mmetsp:Transcript_13938/g.38051  ORF Transcript_13938/g.38051 Transcript_13938/m.38051 type:complete len:325 (-) Transcript_13938:175-1149(-)
MHGPSSDAAFWGGQGGALRYHLGTVCVVKIAGGGPPPAEWAKKSKLQEAFGDFGHILRLEVPNGRGLAYVEFDDKRDAEDMAREMSGKKVCGRQVFVEIAQSSAATKKINIHDRVSEVAQKYRLDDSATAQLLRVFAERSRLATCDMDRDLTELSEHLASSNKPSALVCKMLVDIRCGKPFGPCKFSRSEGGTGPDAARATRPDSHGRARSHDRGRSRRQEEVRREPCSRERDRDKDGGGGRGAARARSRSRGGGQPLRAERSATIAEQRRRGGSRSAERRKGSLSDEPSKRRASNSASRSPNKSKSRSPSTTRSRNRDRRRPR